ncbi:hypothetical protein [Streptomyces olivaceiscleroticus]|uniref:hypothetical protein n=1 Tax=Streptomyces olivaceiscleroticus TaxID=68245 RepID=UPI0031F7EC82
MQRRSSVRGAAVAAAVALATILTSCSGGSDTDTGADDSKGGDSTSSAPVAEPGKFDSLPEPCGLPGRSTLRSLLPTDGSPETSAEAEKVYRGQADITFDTDRRVGCRWKRETSEGSRHLTIDLQRVVSYDGAASDDAKAQELYAKKELAAHIPNDAAKTPPVRTPSPTGSEKGSAGSEKGSAGRQDEKENGQQDGETGTGKQTSGGADERGERPSGGKGAAADPSVSPSARQKGADGETAGKGSGDATQPSDTRTAEGDSPDSSESAGSDETPGSEASLAPRPLADLGDAAFLNDALVTADSGLHRDITVVFRVSNVIVTIEYDQWSTDKSVLPDRRELQEKAQKLAAELAAHWTG